MSLIPFTLMKFIFLTLCSCSVVSFFLALIDIIIIWWLARKHESEEEFMKSSAVNYYCNFKENIGSGTAFLFIMVIFRLFCEVINIW